MTLETNISPKKQIRQVIFIILFAIIFGLSVVVFLVNYYGSSSNYKLRHVLLAPKVLEELWYSSSNPKTGGNARFVFQELQVEYLDPKTNQWKKSIIPLDGYQKLYEAIETDVSLSEPEPSLVKEFETSKTTRLFIKVKTESDAKWQAVTETFQEIQFLVNGVSYRVELHEDNPGSHWAYFTHPGIYEKLLEILQ